MTEYSAADALPDRVTVLTCIGCGAMGREARCEGDCSERKLVLVSAADYDELVRAGHAAEAIAGRLAPAVRAYADAPARAGDARDALLTLRDGSRLVLRGTAPDERRFGMVPPATVTGWWCTKCRTVDLPQPCLGVCVWRPAEWVNLAVYERELVPAEAALRAAASLRGFLTLAAAVTPRAGEWQRNLDALREQARAVLHP